MRASGGIASARSRNFFSFRVRQFSSRAASSPAHRQVKQAIFVIAGDWRGKRYAMVYLPRLGPPASAAPAPASPSAAPGAVVTLGRHVNRARGDWLAGLLACRRGLACLSSEGKGSDLLGHAFGLSEGPCLLVVGGIRLVYQGPCLLVVGGEIKGSLIFSSLFEASSTMVVCGQYSLFPIYGALKFCSLDLSLIYLYLIIKR